MKPRTQERHPDLLAVLDKLDDPPPPVLEGQLAFDEIDDGYPGCI